MARWEVTIQGKNLRKASVEKLVKKMESEFDGATVFVKDASPPESRADRFAVAVGMIGDAKGEFEMLREELQDWYDNLPENFQNGDKGSELQEAIDALESLTSDLENAEGNDVSFPSMY